MGSDIYTNQNLGNWYQGATNMTLTDDMKKMLELQRRQYEADKQMAAQAAAVGQTQYVKNAKGARESAYNQYLWEYMQQQYQNDSPEAKKKREKEQEERLHKLRSDVMTTYNLPLKGVQKAQKVVGMMLFTTEQGDVGVCQHIPNKFCDSRLARAMALFVLALPKEKVTLEWTDEVLEVSYSETEHNLLFEIADQMEEFLDVEAKTDEDAE